MRSKIYLKTSQKMNHKKEERKEERKEDLINTIKNELKKNKNLNQSKKGEEIIQKKNSKATEEEKIIEEFVDSSLDIKFLIVCSSVLCFKVYCSLILS